MLQCYTHPWFIQGAIQSWRFSRGQTRWCYMFACAWQGSWTYIHNTQQTQITYAHVTKTMGNTNKYMQPNCDQATALSTHENSQMHWPIGLEYWIPQTTSSDKPAAPKFPLAIRILSFRSCRCTSTWWIPQTYKCKLMICMARNYSCSTHKLSSPKMPRVHLIWRCIVGPMPGTVCILATASVLDGHSPGRSPRHCAVKAVQNQSSARSNCSLLNLMWTKLCLRILPWMSNTGISFHWWNQ